MASELTIGFLGAGKMATALARGFCAARLTSAKSIIASDVMDAARRAFVVETGVRPMPTSLAVCKGAHILVLAVKPDQVPAVLSEIRNHFTSKHLLISIAAGVTLARLESLLAPGARVIRVMPNTPALVGASASAFATGGHATAADAALVKRLFTAVGVALQVKESLLDAVTGLSGSGPAYAYQVIEALSDGGVAAGLPRAVATTLAAQTLLGAAKMVLETGQHPGLLQHGFDQVGSGILENR